MPLLPTRAHAVRIEAMHIHYVCREETMRVCHQLWVGNRIPAICSQFLAQPELVDVGNLLPGLDSLRRVVRCGCDERVIIACCTCDQDIGILQSDSSAAR